VNHFFPHLKLTSLEVPVLDNNGQKIIRIINISAIQQQLLGAVSSNTNQLLPLTTEVPPPEKTQKIELESIARIQNASTKIGVGVPKEAQDIFNAIENMYALLFNEFFFFFFFFFFFLLPSSFFLLPSSFFLLPFLLLFYFHVVMLFVFTIRYNQTVWKDKSILVMNEIQVDPPYGAANCYCTKMNGNLQLQKLIQNIIEKQSKQRK
jgi:hypothetical protein